MPRIMDCFLSEVLEAGFSMAFLLKINQKKMKRLEKESRKKGESIRHHRW